MVGQHGGSEEEEWKMVSMFGLHRFKRNLPQGSLSDTSDRPIGGCNSWSFLDVLFGCLLGVPSDTIGSE